MDFRFAHAIRSVRSGNRHGAGGARSAERGARNSSAIIATPNSAIATIVAAPRRDDRFAAFIQRLYDRDDRVKLYRRVRAAMAVSKLNNHFRKTFLAGIFAAVPVAVTGFIVWYVDGKTRNLTHWLFKIDVPIVGIFIALAAIYLCGLVATTLLGKYFLKLIDRILSRVPILRPLYLAWKQVALTPGGTEGTFSRVVLIPDETGATHLLGFCSGRPLDGDPNTFCVFVPAAPNPVNGRLYFVHRDKCVFVDVTTEDAFKVVLSTGNYIPPAIGAAAKLMPRPAGPLTPLLRGEG
jgi:uncharacterized membrane protein